MLGLEGLPIDPNEWTLRICHGGWGSNSIVWRLFASVVVTSVVGFLAGSVAKSKGALTAAISNIPSILVWILSIISCHHYMELREKKAFVIVEIIAMPLTTYIAFIAGGFGEKIQKEEFEENTVLGIWPYHWIWGIFPIYWYAIGIAYVIAKFISFQFASWGDVGIIASIMSLFVSLLLPIIAWGYPLLLVHRVLTGEMLSEKNSYIRGIANSGILIFGMGIAIGLHFGSYWLLAKIIF